jgi:hypothetical protein
VFGDIPVSYTGGMSLRKEERKKPLTGRPKPKREG